MINKAYKYLAKKRKPIKKIYLSTDEGVGVYRTKAWLTTNGKDNILTHEELKEQQKKIKEKLK